MLFRCFYNNTYVHTYMVTHKLTHTYITRYTHGVNATHALELTLLTLTVG